MGSARFRSWSFSRENTFRTCPRRFFFEYFSEGEEYAVMSAFLRSTTTLPLLVGTIAHDAIGMALRLFKVRGTVKVNLKGTALKRFDESIAASRHCAEAVRQQQNYRVNRRVLLHHLEERPSDLGEAMARENLEDRLDAFERSSAWQALRSSDLSQWEDVQESSDPKQFVESSPNLGFSSGFHLKIYTPFDHALFMGTSFVIVDWKTGAKTAPAMAYARRQTASYVLWALNRGISLEAVRLQPYWLLDGEQWDPSPITLDEITDVRRGIEAHDAAERRFLRTEIDDRGKPVFHAEAEDFSPKPGRVCGGCKFRSICFEGRAATAATSGADEDGAED